VATTKAWARVLRRLRCQIDLIGTREIEPRRLSVAGGIGQSPARALLDDLHDAVVARFLGRAILDHAADDAHDVILTSAVHTDVRSRRVFNDPGEGRAGQRSDQDRGADSLHCLVELHGHSPLQELVTIDELMPRRMMIQRSLRCDGEHTLKLCESASATAARRGFLECGTGQQ
jgi:hypothetical protein